MKSAPGRAGIATSRWPCSPMPSWSSCALRPSRPGSRSGKTRRGKKGQYRRGGQAECGRTAPAAARAAGIGGAMRQTAVVVALSPAASGGRPTRHILRRARQAPRSLPARAPPLRAPSLPELTPAHWVQIAPLLPRSRRGRPASIPADGGRHPVGHADGRFLARVTGPLWSLANGRGVLSPLAPCGSLGTDPAGLVGS